MKRMTRYRRPACSRDSRGPGARRHDGKIVVDVVKQRRTMRPAAATLKSVARLVLREEHVLTAHVELALVDDTTIRALHRRFCELDTATDVLTFPLNEAGETLAGQIVLSVETAARVGPLHGFMPEHEVLLYAIHGILHLCGYDDRTARDARRMRRRQTQLLQKALDSF